MKKTAAGKNPTHIKDLVSDPKNARRQSAFSVDGLMARNTKSDSVCQFKTQRWKVSPRFYVVRVNLDASHFAILTGEIVTLKDSRSPFLVINSHHCRFTDCFVSAIIGIGRAFQKCWIACFPFRRSGSDANAFKPASFHFWIGELLANCRSSFCLIFGRVFCNALEPYRPNAAALESSTVFQRIRKTFFCYRIGLSAFCRTVLRRMAQFAFENQLANRTSAVLPMVGFNSSQKALTTFNAHSDILAFARAVLPAPMLERVSFYKKSLFANQTFSFNFHNSTI